MFSTHAFKRSLKHMLLSSVMVGALALAINPASAQTASKAQVDALEQQLQQLQQQLQAMKDQVNTTQTQVKKVTDDSASLPKVTFANGRPGWVSADGQNSIQLTGRMHFDMADYASVSRSGTNQSLQSGVNVRRARIGVLGKVAGDWNYAFIGDFGGTSDGAQTSNIEDAHISYNGFRPIGIDLGYTDVPWTLGEATSSNDIMFMERSSAQVIATQFGGGDGRSELGVHSNNNDYWIGGFLTGPTAGATHTGSSSAFAELARGTYQIYTGDNNTSVHLGANAANTAHAQGHQLTLSDRPELRVDTQTFLTTTAMNVDSGNVLGLEGATTYGNFYVDGEYFHYNVNQFATTTAPAPDLGFDGGYVEASYSFGGRRKYNPGNGAYTGVIPDHPMDSSLSSLGALELAARYSVVDLNDGVTNGTSQTTTGGQFGGKQQTYALGLNWYPNTNIRFMLDYIHADVDKLGTNGVTPANAHTDAIAARAQFAF